MLNNNPMMEVVTGKALFDPQPAKKEPQPKRKEPNFTKNSSLLSLQSSPSKKKFGNGTSQRIQNNNFDIGEILAPSYQ